MRAARAAPEAEAQVDPSELDPDGPGPSAGMQERGRRERAEDGGPPAAALAPLADLEEQLLERDAPADQPVFVGVANRRSGYSGDPLELLEKLWLECGWNRAGIRLATFLPAANARRSPGDRMSSLWATPF